MIALYGGRFNVWLPGLSFLLRNSDAAVHTCDHFCVFVQRDENMWEIQRAITVLRRKVRLYLYSRSSNIAR